MAQNRPSEVFTFERLEYGKLCHSPEGPVLPELECWHLVRSTEFPLLLAERCRPSDFGVGGDVRLEDRHATVIQPILWSEHSSLLVYRLRQRPEAGEGQTSRRYWLGRYLYLAEGNADPLTCLEALDREALTGIADPQKVEPRIEVERVEPGPPGKVSREFLRQALIFLLSGIPVCWVGPCTEKEFFEQATELWSEIPELLRPIFSAAWGVEPSGSSGYSFSAVARAPDPSAAFDLASQSWRPPFSLATTNRPFSSQLLVPGHEYWNLQFQQPDWLAEELRQRSGPIVLARPQEEAAFEAPRMDSPKVYRFLRQPGFLALDLAYDKLLFEWLAEKAVKETDLALRPKNYFFNSSRERVFHLSLVKARAFPGKARQRGTLLLWRFLQDGFVPPRSEEDSFSLALFAFFAALLRPASEAEHSDRLIRTIENLVKVMDLADLDREIEEAWHQGLARLIHDPRNRKAHLRLLSQVANQPKWRRYVEWVVAKAPELAASLCFTGRNNIVRDAVQVIKEHSRSTLVEPYYEWLAQSEPSERLRELFRERNFWERTSQDLSLLLEFWWRQGGPNLLRHREGLLPWLNLTPGWKTTDPVLDLFFAQSPDRHKVALLAHELLNGRVPNQLWGKFAAWLLELWPDLYPFRELSRTHWIFALWPPHVRVVCDVGPVTSDVVRSQGSLTEVEDAIRRLSLPFHFLEARLHSRTGWEGPHVTAGAEFLWNECARVVGNMKLLQPSAVTYCGAMQLNLLAKIRGLPQDAHIDRAAHLARQAGVFSEKNQDLLAQLWGNEPTSLQMRLLLGAAPGAALPLDLRQLGLLHRHHRRWIKTHHGSSIPEGRKKLLAVAAAEFMSLGSGFFQEYSSSELWAAFKGIPVAAQGELYPALRVYADPLEPRKIAALISLYLGRSGGPDDEKFGQASRAILELVGVSSGVFCPKLSDILAWVEKGAPDQGKFSLSKILGRRPKVVTPGMHEAYRADLEKIEVADWFLTLLRDLNGAAGGLNSVRKAMQPVQEGHEQLRRA